MVDHPAKGSTVMKTLSREVAKLVLDTVDAGLVQGVGVPKPGGSE